MRLRGVQASRPRVSATEFDQRQVERGGSPSRRLSSRGAAVGNLTLRAHFQEQRSFSRLDVPAGRHQSLKVLSLAQPVEYGFILQHDAPGVGQEPELQLALQ